MSAAANAAKRLFYLSPLAAVAETMIKAARSTNHHPARAAETDEEAKKNKRRLQPWDNCKRLVVCGHLPHPGNHIDTVGGIATWYLVAPPCLLQPPCHSAPPNQKPRKPNKIKPSGSFVSL